MPTYKYQTVLATGVSVFGMFDADDETALSAYLLTRGMTLVNCSEIAIDPRLGSPRAAIPRFVQLRIGERIQEALLTGLPAHVAITAMADEPFEHPLLMAMPWLTGMATCGLLAAVVGAAVVPEVAIVLILTAFLGLCACLGLWIAGFWWLQVRPRTLLLQLARQMAAGHSGSLLHASFLPYEIRSIADSAMSAEQKSLSIAELQPSLGIMQVQRHLFATRMVSPLFALLFLFPAGYLAMLIVVPQFKSIFVGFGVELPSITQMMIGVSDLIVQLRIWGLTALIVFLAVAVCVSYTLLIWSPAAEVLGAVPMLGTSLRLLMQARVARILGVLIRNNASAADALAVATKASGFREVRNHGIRVAAAIRKGTAVNFTCNGLHGLPLSLLLRISDRESSEAARQETAQSFSMFASSLEEASWGHGSILAVILEFFAIMLTGVVVGIFVISMFMPLIRLLNDLSVCLWVIGVGR